MKALILNAGQGKRLLPLTERRPKCLLPLGGKSLMEWQIDSLVACGVSEIAVVVGFGAEHVKEVLHDSCPRRVKATTIFNSMYDVADNLVSCWMARDFMNDDFVLLNGDTVFETRVLRRLLRSEPAPITVTINHKSSYDADDMKVQMRGTQLIAIGKDLPASRTDGESIGMLRFQGEGPRMFRQVLDEALRQEGSNRRWYLSVINDIAKRAVVQTVAADGLDWAEIDFMRDLEHAAKMVAGWGHIGAHTPVREIAQAAALETA